ncbi:MAG: AGE family epimerase/isomerase [Candidatus Coatesbacteria bacterium]
MTSGPTRSRLLGWRDRFEAHLRKDILGFWIRHGLQGRDGFQGAVDRFGDPKPESRRSLVLTARILWTFSAAARRFHDDKYSAVAHRALRVLMTRFHDRRYGGWYWATGAGGRVQDPNKYLYGLSYAIYGLAEYGMMARDRPALALALREFRRLDAVAHDRARGGYHEAFTRGWAPVLGHYPIGPATQRSANTHLHLLEAYTTLLRATGDAKVRDRLAELRALFFTRFANPAGYTHEFMTADWRPLTFESSYGHDIELGWLLQEATIALGEPADDATTVRVAREQVDHALRFGYNRPLGGFFERGPAMGRATKRSMNWWSQAEGLVALLALYATTRDARYFRAFERTAGLVLGRLADREYGEWYGYLDERGRPTRTMKITPWKCPYHNGRACLEIMRRTEALAAG